jgi:hypothetical protein
MIVEKVMSKGTRSTRSYVAHVVVINHFKVKVYKTYVLVLEPT